MEGKKQREQQLPPLEQAPCAPTSPKAGSRRPPSQKKGTEPGTIIREKKNFKKRGIAIETQPGQEVRGRELPQGQKRKGKGEGGWGEERKANSRNQGNFVLLAADGNVRNQRTGTQP